MVENRGLRVAVLLATYNGARFIREQILSLKNNRTGFTLHWIDDGSTDSTRDLTHQSVTEFGIDLREWHQSRHMGYPATFFYLLERVDADIYLFCDQDDIWQPGKIDALVAALHPNIGLPMLCFSEPLIFVNDPAKARRMSDLIADIRFPKCREVSRLFVTWPPLGNTQGLTRALRDLYLTTSEIARQYANGHSWWMYLLAVSAGISCHLSDVPTTLWRQHGSNFSTFVVNAFAARPMHFVSKWRLQQFLRPKIARQAAGFIVMAKALPRSPQLESLLEIARLVATIHKRQPLWNLIRLASYHSLWSSNSSKMFLLLACLLSNAAVDSSGKQQAI